METMTKAGVTYTYNKYEVIAKINETIENIKKWIEENDYQVTGNIDAYKDIEMGVGKWLSKNQMKQIQKYCFWIERKPSLKKVNTFFSL